jgi:flagellar hook-associated protein 3 FlgL
MRISTSSMHQNALTAMLQQQSVLSKTQNQIATGRRVQTPADDPVAAVHIIELQRALQESEQFGKNANIANNRLTLEEQALSDLGTLLQRARELAVQGNNATVDPASRKMLAAEVRGRLQELMDISNRKDAQGEYLFAGYASLTQPFAASSGTVNYFGDQGGRLQQVGASQHVLDSHSGFEVFLSVPQGNGVFVTAASAANTGSGAIASGSITNQSLWVPDDYTIRFISANGDYEIIDSATPANVVAAGSHVGSNVISFNGVNVNLTGAPALGDEFSVSRSRTEDIFSTLGELASALEAGIGTPAQRAQVNSRLGTVLEQLEQTETHLLGIRAEVGTRLSALDSAESSREDQKVELERMTSELRDLDYAEAITRMNQQLIGLQAAHASYAQIAQLSLFNYLK